MAQSKTLAPPDVDSKILEVRGQKMMLDADLADVYGVTTKALNQLVKRKLDRFPEDFKFQLTAEEFDSLRSQIVTSKQGRGGRRYLLWVFTEHGALMVAMVLNSIRAVEMSVFVVRAFIRLRQFARGHAEISKRLDALEQNVAGHDQALKEMFAALRALLAQPEKQRRGIGFRSRERES
jgi:ORF6N domain-containing protein